MSAYVAADLQRAVRARFANCCAYCRTAESLSIAIFEFEHFIPRSAGGDTILENLCFSCPTCNRFKSDRTSASDPITQQEVPLFHPVQDRWADHFAWSEDSATITALTTIGRATIAALRMNRSAMIRLRQMWAAMREHPPELD
jgi:hypothetical protein